jgi:hypothetical protein
MPLNNSADKPVVGITPLKPAREFEDLLIENYDLCLRFGLAFG